MPNNVPLAETLASRRSGAGRHARDTPQGPPDHRQGPFPAAVSGVRSVDGDYAEFVRGDEQDHGIAYLGYCLVPFRSGLCLRLPIGSF
jgi:hypothetical protein